MPRSVLLQNALLLMAAQFLLGLLAARTLAAQPWLGLLVTLVWLWFVMRVGLILRGDMDKRLVKRVHVVPWTTALATAAIWQIPTYTALLFWPDRWGTQAWAGALGPAMTLLERWVPALSAFGGHRLWLSFAVNVALFALVASRTQAVVTLKPRVQPARGKASGEWVAARRRPAGAARKPIEMPDRDEE